MSEKLLTDEQVEEAFRWEDNLIENISSEEYSHYTSSTASQALLERIIALESKVAMLQVQMEGQKVDEHKGYKPRRRIEI